MEEKQKPFLACFSETKPKTAFALLTYLGRKGWETNLRLVLPVSYTHLTLPTILLV